MSLLAVPKVRIYRANSHDFRPPGDHSRYVLYWMTSARRSQNNYALDHAHNWCSQLQLPLLVFEPMRCGHRWANRRQLAFVLAGMSDNAQAFAQHAITYYPYVEAAPNAGKGLLMALAQEAALVVGDYFPCFFLPSMLAAAAKKLSQRAEWVDSNGLLPLASAPKSYPTAYAFRRFLQSQACELVTALPQENSLTTQTLSHAPIADHILQKWPMASSALLARKEEALAQLPVDQTINEKHCHPEESGGRVQGQAKLTSFIGQALANYAEYRSHPEVPAASRLSAYLNHGHVSIYCILRALWQQEQWQPQKLSQHINGSRSGFWGMSANAESFIDEVLTWRELSYHTAHCNHLTYDQYSSLPDWAQETLKQHSQDQRIHMYTISQFEQALTHDPLWNAAQIQLKREGRIHNYLRMLWGKKVLEWSKTPQEALATLIELNNKYALDGCNPNSYSGIFWTLGRYDRPWPERAVFGKIRSMSSENTARKYNVKNYLHQYSA